MRSIKGDIKEAFSKGNSSSVQLILVNAFVFVGLFLVKLILSMSPETKVLVLEINENLLLHANLPDFLAHSWSILTYGFVNSSFFSFLFNCIALYWFGFLVQDFLGNRKLVNIYFLGYVFAGIFYLFTFSVIGLSKATVNLNPLVHGATAAVYAVMFATVTLIPDYEFYLFRKIFLKIKFLAVAFLVFSFLDPAMGMLNLGGAFLGYVYIKLLRIGIDLGSPIEAVQEWLGNMVSPKPKKQLKAIKFSHSTVGQTRGIHLEDEPDIGSNQEEVDLLLDKISVSGYQSLTKEEKERLYRASQSDDI